ncbi:hypothetical protein [Sorangium sp. So ce394]|uniref:hypothetical protein n=1 Tax=Sorangium sp. So ce394 TaxID=3133310 RepID=UPI003F5C40AD
MSTLRDILDLPEEVTRSAFVVRLAEAVHHADALMDLYAITPDIHHALDRGLGLIATAIAEKRNVAAFIHGSFGSGKSHYMAVLSLLAANHPRPWGEPKLHDLYVKHEWVKQRKLLRLHLNMIDAPSLGDKVFAAYLDETRRLHPDAPIAPLFADGPLFENAARLRAQLGDEAFFAQLNAGAQVDSRWGKKAGDAWTGARFDQARESAEPKVRAALFSALIKTVFPAFAQQASAFLGFEQGMVAMSRHAASLGYDAIVFFLDELVLWLATKASSPETLNNEIGKLAKLVEGQAAEQAVPIVTFAARQRDIGEMVGEQYAGADATAVRNSLRFWEGRFDTVKLPDKDLPAIIAKRVVHPKDDAAAKKLSAAFDTMRRTLGQAAWGTLLGDLGDEAAFRQIYPFSPALVEALVAMSHYLQRERTSLKILVEMLVGQLDDFEIGKLVSAGDLYDALAEGEEPMDGTMRERFAAAKRLYDSELLPVIWEQNQTGTPERCQRLRNDGRAVGCANCRETRCRNDNRIAKTLLLASLAPNCHVFRNLTASRLVQLNHGTLRSPVPGGEATLAATRVRAWAKEVGKVRVQGEEDPLVTVVLEGVDVRPIVQAAGHYDRPGPRKAKLRELLFEALGLEPKEGAVQGYKVLWRGTDREGTVVFGNVREMDDGVLRAGDDDAFRVVIDYPFDDPGRSPQEDEQRVATFVQGASDTPTIVWLPSFLAESAQRDLGDLVVLDQILDGDNWKSHLANLRPDDQTRAREELTSRATQKRERLRRALDAAYGLVQAQAGVLDPTRSVAQHFHVLRSGTKIRGLSAADLRRGLVSAIEQLLDDLHPHHPRFSDKVTRGKLEKELLMLAQLCESDGQRLPLAKNEQNALRFSDELRLVNAREGQATLVAQAYDEIDRQLRAANVDTPDVAAMRRLLDPARTRGYTPEVADFLVLAYATVRGRELVRGGQTVKSPTLGRLDGDAELLQPRLPDEAAWHRALGRAGTLFGITVGKAHTAKNVRAFAEKLNAAVERAFQDRADTVAELLARRAEFFSAAPARLRTARRVAELLHQLKGRDAVAQVHALADIEPETSDSAMHRHLTSARANAEVLGNDVNFASFPALVGRTDGAAAEILAALRDVLDKDEIMATLAPKLGELSIRAQKLLQPPPPPPPPPIGPTTEPPIGATTEELRAVVSSPADLPAVVERLKEALAHAPRGARIELAWKVVK